MRDAHSIWYCYVEKMVVNQLFQVQFFVVGQKSSHSAASGHRFCWLHKFSWLLAEKATNQAMISICQEFINHSVEVRWRHPEFKQRWNLAPKVWMPTHFRGFPIFKIFWWTWKSDGILSIKGKPGRHSDGIGTAWTEQRFIRGKSKMLNTCAGEFQKHKSTIVSVDLEFNSDAWLPVWRRTVDATTIIFWARCFDQHRTASGRHG